jgi:D-alanine-D-alanine ligase
MKKINKYIEIIRTTNKKLSSMSEGPSLLILDALRTKYSKVEITIVNTVEDLEDLVLRKPDLCFLGLKQLPLSRDNAEMDWISDYLDEKDINYTGSKSSAIALEFNKQEAKKVIISAGLNSAKYFVGDNIEDLKLLDMNYPLFVKPTNMGNKKGIDSNSEVNNIEEYSIKINSLNDELNSIALVEEYLPGREFSVAILEAKGLDELIALPIEVIIKKNENGDRILGSTNMSADEEKILEVKDSKIHRNISDLAINVFRTLGARDYGRIDIRLDDNGVANFIEANLIPGLSSVSFFPIANLLNASVKYRDTILSIVDIAFYRNKSKQSLKESSRLILSE